MPIPQPTQQQLLDNIRTKVAAAIESSSRQDKDGTSFESRLLQGVMQNTCDLARILSMNRTGFRGGSTPERIES